MDIKIDYMRHPIQLELSEQAIEDFKVMYRHKTDEEIDTYNAERLGLILLAHDYLFMKSLQSDTIKK